MLVVQGCAAAVPAVAYGVSKVTTPSTPSAQPAQPVATQRTYPEYLTEMERINMEREKAGLQPRPIMTQEEWVCAQKAGSTPTAAASPSPAPAPTPVSPAAEPPEKAAESK